MDVVKSMKIIIADAKSLKEKHFPIEKQTPLFFNKAESLRKQLKELDIDQIHDLMKISFKQSSLIYDYFHNEETFAAINLFNGVVFKQLDLKNYQKEEWDYFSSIYYLTLIFNTVSPSRTFACRCLTPENKNATDWIVQSVAFSEYCFLILFQRLQADYSAVRC